LANLSPWQVTIGAEGATAPETLRHPNRREMRLWKAGWRSDCPLIRAVPDPTEDVTPPGFKTLTGRRGNLSGSKTEGALERRLRV